MPPWNLTVALDASEALPTFLQIARAITNDIRRGRLRPRDRLPSSRRLAKALGVHRNTVLSAYRELSAEGWITTEAARGTFVSAKLPERLPKGARRSRAPSGLPVRVGFELRGSAAPPREHPLPPDVISLTGGLPDLGLVPMAALGRAYRRALRLQGRALLDYGSAQGHPRLREAIASMLASTRGLVVRSDDVLLTRGSQMGLYLTARVLLAPGEAIAVEGYGYRPAWEAFRLAGAELIPIAVDAEGLRVDELDKAIVERDCRAVYVTPHHQYPTTVTLSPGRRLSLLELARRRKVAVIEDDYDHEFHYDGRPVLPLASMDGANTVIYVGTLSKVFAPGLRLGYVMASPPVIARLTRYRSYVDHHGDQTVEAAIAELIEDGELARHANRARRIYERRRDAFMAQLKKKLADTLTFQIPSGGVALWAKVPGKVDVDAWATRALAEGVGIAPASRFAFDGRTRPYVRLGFARVDEARLAEVVAVLARTRPCEPAP